MLERATRHLSGVDEEDTIRWEAPKTKGLKRKRVEDTPPVTESEARADVRRGHDRASVMPESKRLRRESKLQGKESRERARVQSNRGMDRDLGYIIEELRLEGTDFLYTVIDGWTISRTKNPHTP